MKPKFGKLCESVACLCPNSNQKRLKLNKKIQERHSCHRVTIQEKTYDKGDVATLHIDGKVVKMYLSFLRL